MAKFRVDQLDWSLLETLAKRHRITGLFFDALQRRRIVPPQPQSDALRAAARKIALSELMLSGELTRVLGLLSAVGIAPLVLKGPAISMLAFGKLGLRQNRDVDLLINEAERDEALRTLTSAGYEIVADAPGRDAPTDFRQDGHRKDLNLRHSQSGLLIELHWRLFDSAVLSGLFERARFSVGSRPALGFDTLPPEENLIFVCMHGAQHAWSRLKWLVDAHALMIGLGNAKLEDVYLDAKRRGLHRAMAQAALLSEALFGMDPPPSIAADRREWRVAALTAIAMRVLTHGGDREIEDMRFGSTLKTLSQYLLMDRRDYLVERMRFDLGHGAEDGQDRPLWRLIALQAPVRLARWLAAHAGPFRPRLGDR